MQDNTICTVVLIDWNGPFQSFGLTKGTQDACEALGVSSEGSILDLMNRLLELLHFKDIYPKLFMKLRKAGGEKELDWYF